MRSINQYRGRKKLDPRVLNDIDREFQRYCDEVNASDRKPTAKATYIQHADRFVRWLHGEVRILSEGQP